MKVKLRNSRQITELSRADIVLRGWLSQFWVVQKSLFAEIPEAIDLAETAERVAREFAAIPDAQLLILTGNHDLEVAE